MFINNHFINRLEDVNRIRLEVMANATDKKLIV